MNQHITYGAKAVIYDVLDQELDDSDKDQIQSSGRDLVAAGDEFCDDNKIDFSKLINELEIIIQNKINEIDRLWKGKLSLTDLINKFPSLIVALCFDGPSSHDYESPSEAIKKAGVTIPDLSYFKQYDLWEYAYARVWAYLNNEDNQD